MSSPESPLEFESLRKQPLSGRPSKVRLADLGWPMAGNGTVADLLDSLPECWRRIAETAPRCNRRDS